MEKVIKKINETMGDFEGSMLTIRFFRDKVIVFEIYEQEIPIVVDRTKKEVYLDCETTSSHLTKDMLEELTQITKIIEENLDTVLACL